MKVKLRRHRVNESNVFDLAMNAQDQTEKSAYKYSIISLNKFFEQPGNDLSTEHYVNVGSYIQSLGYTDGQLHSGIVKQVVKDESGYIQYLIILDDKVSKFVKVSADNIKLLK